jgi:6-phosphogluconolactonase
MQVLKQTLALGLIAAASSAVHADSDFLAARGVFVMTNDADANEVIAYERNRDGALGSPHRYLTGGRGSGGTVDPLASQGSLTLSSDGNWLLAANAGSGSVSVFRVFGSRLLLTDRTPSGGSEPNAVAQHGKLVYVLNTAASSSVVGYRLDDGHLTRIADSQRFLSGNTVNSSSIAFTPNGRFLVVTERATNSVDVFRVQNDGRLAPIVVNPSAAPGAFSAVFAPNGTLIVSETGGGDPLGSTVSSYTIGADGKLLPVSIGVPTLGDANCWNAVTPDGRFVYTSNAGTASIAGFRIGAHGELAAIGGTVVGTNPAGSANLDVTVSSDGRFLYSLNAATGAVGAFAIQRDGSLVNLGTRGGLPTAAGLNGIASN